MSGQQREYLGEGGNERRNQNRFSWASHRSVTDWRFSSLWRPLSDEYDCQECGRESVDHGFYSRWNDNAAPSVQPRTFSVFGGTDPITGETIGASAFRNSSSTIAVEEYPDLSDYPDVPELPDLRPFNDRNDYEMAESSSRESTNAGREEVEDPYDSQSIHSIDMFSDKMRESKGSSGSSYDEPQRGLVSRKLSSRHDNGNPRTSQSPSMAGSEHFFARANSKRTLARDSQLIQALPSLGPGTKHLDEPKGPIARNISLARTLSRKGSTRSRKAPPKDPNLILWDGPQDPENPMNWSRAKKWACTMVLAWMTFCVTFASSVLSPGTVQAAEHFNVSEEVFLLATALFVAGFAFGPVIWGPFSELYGRKYPMFFGFAVFAIFQIPVAVAPNVETVFICRFLAGFFGCAPLSIVGGCLADFWMPLERGVAISIFSVATFLGPTGGPVIGGFLVMNEDFGWRWTAWITLIFAAFFGTIGWIVLPESFGPVLLSQKARRLRFATHNWAIHAPMDEVEINLKDIAQKYCSKPILMLIYEPILLLITIYMSFIYGILYLFFAVYPISFIQQRHWSLGVGSLPFLAVMWGVVIAGFINFGYTKRRWARITKEKGRLPPEERLIPMMIGSVALPVGLFWFGWTSDPNMTPIPQIVAGVATGLGICLIFLQGINYIVDVYMMYSASAIAGNTFIRSLAGAAFPMFTKYMYDSLGIPWATSILGFVAIALIPVPILFFLYGARIRKISRYAPKFGPGMGGPPGMGGGPPGGGPPGGMMGGGPPGGMMGGGGPPGGGPPGGGPPGGGPPGGGPPGSMSGGPPPGYAAGNGNAGPPPGIVLNGSGPPPWAK